METRVWSRRSLRLGCALWLVLALCGLFLAIVQPQSQIAAHPLAVPDAPVGGTLYVAPGGDCNGMTPCYGTIQAAVDAAEEESLIKIAAGTYTGVSVYTPSPDYHYSENRVTQVVFISKSLTLRGGYTPANWETPDFEQNLTVVDAQGAGRAMFIDAGNQVTLECLRLTGGQDKQGFGGSGLYIWESDVTLNYMQITDNLHEGLYFRKADVFLWRSEVIGNVGTGILGTIHHKAEFDECLIRENSERGLLIDKSEGELLIRNSTVTDNGLAGISLYVVDFVMDSNVITGNGDYGVTLHASKGTMSGDYIAQNVNGIQLESIGSIGCDVELTNVVIADNRVKSDGIGIYCHGGKIRLQHSTVVRNGTYGVKVVGYYTPYDTDLSHIDIMNTIVAGHNVGVYVSPTSESSFMHNRETNTARLTGILWGTGDWANSTDWSAAEGDLELGEGHIWGDPGFVDPDAGNYHITANSLARDAAGDAGVSMDMDGQFRPMDYQYDIGADEYPGPVVSVVGDPVTGVVNQGAALTYAWDVGNPGSEGLGEVVLTNTLSAWQIVSAVTTEQGHCSSRSGDWGSEITCHLGTLALGTSSRVTVEVQIASDVPLGQRLSSIMVAEAPGTIHEVSSELYAHNCYARVNDDSTIYNSVQVAVDAASAGDTVKVAGFCVGAQPDRGIRQVVYLTKTLTLQGGYTPGNWEIPDFENHPAILDGVSVGRVLYISGAGSLVEGFRIVNGYGYNGGGIYIANNAKPVLQYNQVVSNTALNDGGGIYVRLQAKPVLSYNQIAYNTALNEGGGICFLPNTFPEVKNNQIISNTATGDGGGVSLAYSGAVLQDNLIAGNHSHKNGGGVFLTRSTGRTTLRGNVIKGNVAGLPGNYYAGGGVYSSNEWDADASSQWATACSYLVGNEILGNIAGSGGGMYLYGVFAIEQNYIHHNSAMTHGGGLYVSHNPEHKEFTSVIISNTVVENTAVSQGGGGYVLLDGGFIKGRANTFSRNSANEGGGLYAQGKFTLDYSTVTENQGEGIVIIRSSGADMAHNLIDHNTRYGIVIKGGTVNLVHTNITRNGSGAGIYMMDSPGIIGQYLGCRNVIYNQVTMRNVLLAEQPIGIQVLRNSESVAIGCPLDGSHSLAIDGVLWSDVAKPLLIQDNVDTEIEINNEHTGPAAFEVDGYHIRAESAARDVGSDPGIEELYDIDGDLRPQGMGYDIGVDEYAEVKLALTAQPEFVVVDRGYPTTHTFELVNLGSGTPAQNVILEGHLDNYLDITQVTASQGQCAVAGNEQFSCTLGTLAAGAQAAVTLVFQVDAGVAPRYYMTTTVTGTAKSTVPVTVTVVDVAQDCHARINDSTVTYKTVQAAVDAASPGDLVKVAGTCIGAHYFDYPYATDILMSHQVFIDKDLMLRGGYTPTNWEVPDYQAHPTVLDAVGRGG